MLVDLKINFTVGDELGSPLIKILLDDYVVLYEGVAISEFQRSFDLDDGEHELKIVHYGKLDSDHKLDSAGNILVDKFVHIDKITIDNIDLKNEELWTGEFWPVYNFSYVEDMIAQGKDLPACISPNLYLGHNGTWRYNFFCPFVDWIITQRKLGPKLDGTIFKTSRQLLEEAKKYFKDLPEL
jgi:hypothetical protein